MKLVLFTTAIVLVVLATVGCGGNSSDSATRVDRSVASGNARKPKFPPAGPAFATLAETGPFAAGRKVYNANGCIRCHAIATAAGSGGPDGPKEGEGKGPGKNGFGGGRMGGVKGPALTTVGDKRSRDWIMEHVRNPKAHNPRSRMPGFADKIEAADLGLLADFLASQKSES